MLGYRLVQTTYRAQQGFTLLELLLVIMLTGPIIYAGLSTHSYIWGQSWQGQLAAREAQNFYALGHWLARDIRQELGKDSTVWQWQEQSQCLLFADKGVRIRNQQLQWKPTEGNCTSNGWLGLHDANGFKITDLTITEIAAGYRQLCLVGRVSKNQKSASESLNWCYAWHVPIYSAVYSKVIQEFVV
ncbi:hypothetical protein CWE13_05365 [Aliidiomarina shirensis]|uniref:Prepilin-type cleavage/methylation domain-containing protein n=1 Tax=Aliidiomarina shirensis TaxID=1048642 RepID=A0A432WUG0_9GAMM|nr:prepilin-type N-terminal cleavage/methylation domain-containing protein [Aliidiomarina shirensis]RUO37389.1 hypothetical protein CWE13_05365 [Aliidiomarina shirensis]